MSTIALDLELWPRQLQAFESEGTEILFGGASEGGKSHLVRVILITFCLAVEGLQCTLIRKRFEDILKNHVEGPTGFKVLLRSLIEAKKARITEHEVRFHNGSLISFQHCQDERQFDSAQGVEKHVLALDEAPQISERLIRFFRGWCRMPIEMKARLPEWLRNKLPLILYTGNPIGASVGFFRRHFVKARAPFEIEYVEGFKRQYIPSKAEDNKSVDLAAHHGRISGISTDPGMILALEGDWDAPVGDFFREWNEEKHVVPDFLPPAHWFRYRSFDWGTAEPFAVYWWAVSDGESFRDHRDVERWYPRGALICYREWYGCNPEHPAEGLRLRNEEMAEGILKRSPMPYEVRVSTVTDSLPFQDRGGTTIAETFAKCGVLLTLGDTSRVPGWSQMRGRLKGIYVDSNDKEPTPMIYFCSSCRYARDYIPAIPRHDTKMEDAAESGEATHAPDAIRIACMSRARVVDQEPKAPDTQHVRNDLTFDAAVKKIQQHKDRANGSRW